MNTIIKFDAQPVTAIAAPPAPQDLPGRLAWLEARYLKNTRDDEFKECLRDILNVDSEGRLLPTAIRDPLNGETRGMQASAHPGTASPS